MNIEPSIWDYIFSHSGLYKYISGNKSQLHLSRILREAVTNVLRHADAKRITLAAIIENDGFMLEVADDGKGCPAATVKQHRGMKGMHARALVLNASLHWEHADPHGCRVRLVVPLRNLSGEIAADQPGAMARVTTTYAPVAGR